MSASVMLGDHHTRAESAERLSPIPDLGDETFAMRHSSRGSALGVGLGLIFPSDDSSSVERSIDPELAFLQLPGV